MIPHSNSKIWETNMQKILKFVMEISWKLRNQLKIYSKTSGKLAISKTKLNSKNLSSNTSRKKIMSKIWDLAQHNNL